VTGAADPTELSAMAAATAIRTGQLTSEALVTACLARIAEREDTVHAWVHLDHEAALAAARRADAQPADGPLHGVPVGVKDLLDTADAPTGYGSPIHAGHRPDADAAAVANLREAGAVVLGKTVTTEFALFHPGPTANPRDPERTPGGSSSGSAAAVADRMVPVALGTQTAGSIVRPASFCGTYGYKPTFGTVPTAGCRPVGPSLDTIGPLARSVEDLALVTAVLAGGGAGHVIFADRSPSIAFARTPEWEHAEVSTRDRITALATDLGLPRVALPADFAQLVAAQTTIMDAEAAVALDDEWRAHPDQLSAELQELLARGRATPADDVRAARTLVAACRAALPAALAGHDALLVPSTLGEAPVGLDATGDPLFCRSWTALGAPAVAVPGLTGPDGLPLGVQVVAPPDRDADALAAAAVIGRHLAGVGGEGAR
jgi:Asp-tRNA(Asn)/Glu-tRNA(Gln) amidotransferase A subunit family amidase